MGKESNDVTMQVAGYVGGLQVRRIPYGTDVSERDTDPEITQDYIKSVPVAVRLTLLERVRLWAGRIFVRWAWRLMP